MKITTNFNTVNLSCSSNESEQVVNMYSQRHYDVDQKQYDNFEEKTE